MLLRVGIDSGAGGTQGPLFEDETFEFICIPDYHGKDERTYGNTIGRVGRSLVEYFPERVRSAMACQSMHVDPDFESLTYGDPTSPKRGLRHLRPGDLLAFYCGLAGWGACTTAPGLYLVGYFDVEMAGLATELGEEKVHRLFGENFHVRHLDIYEEQRDRLVLVKGGTGSRLLRRATLISEVGWDKAGRPIKVLSKSMQKVFGDFDGRISITRSPPRRVKPDSTFAAAQFLRSLE